jgi:hypothetical protein
MFRPTYAALSILLCLSACASPRSRLRGDYPDVYSADGCPNADALEALLAHKYLPGTPIAVPRTDLEAHGGRCATSTARDVTECEIELGCSYSIQATFQVLQGIIASATLRAMQVLE